MPQGTHIRRPKTEPCKHNCGTMVTHKGMQKPCCPACKKEIRKRWSVANREAECARLSRTYKDTHGPKRDGNVPMTKRERAALPRKSRIVMADIQNCKPENMRELILSFPYQQVRGKNA